MDRPPVSRWTDDTNEHALQRRRRESNPLETVLQTVAQPSGSSVIQSKQVSPPGVEPGLQPSQSRVPPPHSEDVLEFSTPPRNWTSSCSFEGCRASGTLAGHFTRMLTAGSSNPKS